MSPKRMLAVVASSIVAGVTAFAVTPIVASEFPNRPVKLIVAGPPGGGTDFLARLIADRLTQRWPQPVVVENRPGASGIIGTKHVLTAAPDGHVMMLGHSATHAIVPAMYDPAPYDPIRDFAPVALVATAPELLIVAADSPIRSLKDLLASARSNPGKLTYGSPGVGLPQHLLGYMLARAAEVDMRHVPYKGSAPALNDLIGGHITAMFVTPAAAMPFIQQGRVRALAVSSSERSAMFPDLPTLSELGYPSLSKFGWFAVFAPARTPIDVVTRTAADIAAILAEPDVKAKVDAQFTEVARATPQEFARFHRDEVAKWTEVVRQSGVKAAQ